MDTDELKIQLEQIETNIDNIKQYIGTLKQNTKKQLADTESVNEKEIIINNYKKQMNYLKTSKNLKNKYDSLYEQKNVILNQLNEPSDSVGDVIDKMYKNYETSASNIKSAKEYDINNDLKKEIDTLINTKLANTIDSDELNNISEVVYKTLDNKDVSVSSDSSKILSNITNCLQNKLTSSLDDVCNVRLTKTDQTNIINLYNYLLQLKQILS